MGWFRDFRNYCSPGNFTHKKSLEFTQKRAPKKKKTPKPTSVWKFCTQKRHVDARGQWRMTRLVQNGRKALVTQVTVLYNSVEQKSISEHHLSTFAEPVPTVVSKY